MQTTHAHTRPLDWGGVALITVSAAGFATLAIFGKLAFASGMSLPTMLALRFSGAAALFWAILAVTGLAAARLSQRKIGQLLVMGLMALFYSSGLALFGLDLAFPIGLFTGLAMFVPYLGFGLGLVLALLAGLLQFASVKALVMVGVVYGLGQLLESLYLTPRLVGERIGLHPLAVIFALLAFGQLFGFVGILVALPASAVLLVAMRRARTEYLASRFYRE